MNIEEMINTIKEKTGLSDEQAAKAGEFMTGKSLVGKKDEIVKGLMEKVGISEEIANKVYEAIAGALAGGIAEKVKGLFGK